MTDIPGPIGGATSDAAEPIEITERLLTLGVDRAAGMVDLSFAMKRPGLPPSRMVIPADQAMQLGAAILRAFCPNQVLPGGEKLRRGFDVEGCETGLIGDGRVCLTISILGDIPLGFALSQSLAERLGQQLISDAAQGPPAPDGRPN